MQQFPSLVTPLECPLCTAEDIAADIVGAEARRYFCCQRCRLIFTGTADHLDWPEQEARYRLHRNRPDDPGYVRFLRRAVDPLLPFLTPDMQGLDYGCGPGPTISHILAGHALACDDYDPIFTSGELRPPYDFVFATECFEHFFRPGDEIARIKSLLSPGGYLAVMTERWTDLAGFRSWYYTLDTTHVCFFHAATFDYVTEAYGFERLPVSDHRVTLLRLR